jgi:hypothetical protein
MCSNSKTFVSNATSNISFDENNFSQVLGYYNCPHLFVEYKELL